MKTKITPRPLQDDNGQPLSMKNVDTAARLILAGETFIMRGQPLAGAEYLNAASTLVGLNTYDTLLASTRKAYDHYGYVEACNDVDPDDIQTIITTYGGAPAN